MSRSVAGIGTIDAAAYHGRRDAADFRKARDSPREIEMKRARLITFGMAVMVAACDQPTLPTTMTPASSARAAAADGGRLRSFKIPTPNSQPRQITLGSDGNMWFTESEFNVSQIGVVDAKGKIREFVVPSPGTQPSDIVSGRDGALWFTEPSGFPNVIGRVTTAGEFTEFGPGCDANTCSSVPEGIASGPDGNIWFTESLRNAIGKLTPSGEFTFYLIPTPGANPHGITVGPDGALWFTEFNANQIGRITTAGVITEFGLVTGSADRITLGPDGNLWFTEPFPFDSRIGRITPSGVITEFPLADNTQPRDIVAASDGNLWFTAYGTGQLARITPDGVVTNVQAVKGGPWGIGRGVGGTVWLTQFDGNQVSRFTLGP
jgi:virginiamycin B lyase